MAVNLHPWMRSPACEIHWAGFVGHSVAMQREGWEFAIEQDYYDLDHMHLAMRHRRAGWMGVARCMNPNDLIAVSSMDRRRVEQREPVFKAAVMKTDSTIVSAPALNYAKFQRIDMEPEVEMAASFHPKRIFREWREPQEIIVEPKTVQGLLEEIKRLQSPELAEIRQRNRQRPLVDQVPEFACATILQFGT